MTEPKPCPFCGALPTLFDNPCYFYQCANAACQGQEMSWNDTIEDALALWNTRPIEDTLQARIAELEEERDEWRSECHRILAAHKKAIATIYDKYPDVAQELVSILENELVEKKE